MDIIVNRFRPNFAEPNLRRKHTEHHMYLYCNFLRKLARYIGSPPDNRRPGEPLIIFLYIADL